jgi:hypothetical protein
MGWAPLLFSTPFYMGCLRLLLLSRCQTRRSSQCGSQELGEGEEAAAPEWAGLCRQEEGVTGRRPPGSHTTWDQTHDKGIHEAIDPETS